MLGIEQMLFICKKNWADGVKGGKAGETGSLLACCCILRKRPPSTHLPLPPSARACRQAGHVGQPTSLDAVNLTRDGGEVMLLASLGRRWDMTLKEEVFKIRDKMTALVVCG